MWCYQRTGGVRSLPCVWSFMIYSSLSCYLFDWFGRSADGDPHEDDVLFAVRGRVSGRGPAYCECAGDGHLHRDYDSLSRRKGHQTILRHSLRRATHRWQAFRGTAFGYCVLFFIFVCIFSRSVPNIMFPSIKRLFYNVYFKQFLWNIVSSVISALPSEWRHCWKRLMNYECLSVAFLIISTIVLSYDSILNIGTVKNHKRTCRRNEEFDDLRECCVLVGCE